MKKQPIDTTEITFLVAGETRALTNFETKQPKLNEKGEPLSSVRLLAQTASEMSIISVTVPGLTSVLKVNDQVTVKGLVSEPWVNKAGALVDRYEAKSIDLASRVGKAAA